MKIRDPMLERKILELVIYDRETGVMTWGVKKDDCWASMIWNSKHPGKVIGFPDKDGYLMMKIKGSGKNRILRMHRVAWFIHYGEWPDGEIDHENHVRDDNRILNLRDTGRQGNQKNLPLRKSSVSGFTGVSWHKLAGKWRARLMVDKKEVNLGLFSDPVAANEAVVAARLANNYHKNHGAPQ